MTQHLIHIGWPKAGSTWLQAWFDAHPQIAYCPGGIAGFTNVYALAALPPETAPLWRATSHEGLILPGDPRVPVDSTVGINPRLLETLQAARCADLAELFPSAAILIVTRGYRAMILSSFSQFVRTGGSIDLATMLANSARHNPWNYDWVVAQYEARFPGRVIVLPFELLEQCATGFAAELEARLGLQPSAGAVPAKLNPSLSSRELVWYPRIARLLDRLPFAKHTRRLYARVAFKNRLRVLIAALDRLKPTRPDAEPSVDAAQLEMFRGEAAALLERNPLFRPYADAYLCGSGVERTTEVDRASQEKLDVR